MTKILITVEGGIVQSVYSDTTEVELLILDYDTDGALEDDIKRLNGEEVYAYNAGEAEFDPTYVVEAYTEIKNQE